MPQPPPDHALRELALGWGVGSITDPVLTAPSLRRVGSGLLERGQGLSAEAPPPPSHLNEKYLLHRGKGGSFVKWEGSQGWAQLLFWDRNAGFLFLQPVIGER